MEKRRGAAHRSDLVSSSYDDFVFTGLVCIEDRERMGMNEDEGVGKRERNEKG